MGVGCFPLLSALPGGLAQLGERLAGSQKVRGSSPLSSTRPDCTTSHPAATPCKTGVFSCEGKSACGPPAKQNGRVQHPTLHHLRELPRSNRLSIADPDALVGPMWPQHGSVRFEVPVTFLVETLLVNCSHLVRHTHEVHFPHLAGGNVELHNRAWASANHVPIDF